MTISVSQIEILKFAFVGVIAVFLAAFALPTPTKAATLPYIPQTQLELISYMQGIVDTLQAQIAAGGTVSGSGSTRVQTGTANVAVSTKVELKASFDAGNSSSVYAWFEYGEGTSLNKRTARVRVSNIRGDADHKVTLTGLKSGAMYSYRPVFELSGGAKYYGTVRTFGSNALVGGVITEGNANSSNSSRGSLRTDETRYEAYNRVPVFYTAPRSAIDANVRIGLYEVGAANDAYIFMRNTGQSTTGTIYFKIREAGNYEFRLFYDGSNGEVATRRITVR